MLRIERSSQASVDNRWLTCVLVRGVPAEKAKLRTKLSDKRLSLAHVQSKASPLDNDHERAREFDFNHAPFDAPSACDSFKTGGWAARLARSGNRHPCEGANLSIRPERASTRAREGRHCSANGDRDGHVVWEKVAVIAEQLLTIQRPDPRG